MGLAPTLVVIYDLHIQQVALATGSSAALSYEVEIELVEA
jgi:hypothetical protein